jgi:hypothetical protein
MGEPHRDRLGLTVTHQGEHTLWVDQPERTFAANVTAL